MRTEPLVEVSEATPKKDGRGRRPTFGVSERAWLADLIRQHGIRGTQRVAGVSICINTLIKIGREHSIQLPRGRGQRRAA